MTAVESDAIYAERILTEVQTQIEKTLLGNLQLGNNAVSNGIKTSSP